MPMNLSETLKSERSFTLVEMLLVISIIGILSSFTVASVSDYVDKARIVKAMNFASGIEKIMISNQKGKWDLDVIEDGKIKDLSGQGNDGTVFGATTTGDTPQKYVGSGGSQKALLFDGNDDYVDIGEKPALKPSERMTVSLWFKVADYPSGNAVMQGDYTTDFKGYALGIGNDGNIFFWVSVDDPIGRISVTSYPNPVSKNKWHHIAATFDGSTAKLYLDSKKIKEYSLASAVPLLGSNDSNFLGKGSWGPSNFNGMIDDVQVYSDSF